MENVFETDSFSKARMKLTFFYTGVILCIILVFSVFLFVAQNNDYRRIVLQQDFGRAVPRRLTTFQRRVVIKQVTDLRTAFLYELIIIDSVILLVGGVLSYFFAEQTLRPINKALSNQKNFLADASHELRTPLAAIQTAIEVVLRKEQKSPHIYKETLNQVLEEARRMRKLIEELLLLSRIDMDQVTILPTKVSLTTTAKSAVIEISALALQKKLTINENIQNGVFVMGEEERIKQLILVLLDNAIKYTQSEGEIAIIVQNKSQPKVIVQDTGKGIAKEKQKDIFKRFYQVDRSHTGSGAGLGLAIAASIMKLHQGTLTVESELDKGSKFICTFPGSRFESVRH